VRQTFPTLIDFGLNQFETRGIGQNIKENVTGGWGKMVVGSNSVGHLHLLVTLRSACWDAFGAIFGILTSCS
jgi:hypothetical protein